MRHNIRSSNSLARTSASMLTADTIEERNALSENVGRDVDLTV
jgi:hypothetical protein